MSTDPDILKERGMQQVSDNNWGWKTQAKLYAPLVLNPGEEITGEDIRNRLTLIIGEPGHPNAWGALVSSMHRQGLIDVTDKMMKSKSPKNHSHRYVVWCVR